MRSRLVRGAGVTAIGFFASRFITFGTYVAIAVLITPKEAGQFAAGTVVTGLATLFAEGGMLSAVIQWRGDDVDEAASTAFAATLVNGVLLSLLALAAAPLIGLFFHSGEVGRIAAASSGMLILRGLQVVPDALLQRRFSFLRRVAVDPIGAAAFAAVAIVACADGMGAWGLVLGTYAMFVVQVVSSWMFIRWLPRRRQMSMATWRRLVGFGRHVVASEVVRQVTLRLDALLLGRFSGAAPLGQYTYGQRIATQPSATFTSVAAYVLLPAYARLAEDLPRLRRSVLETMAAIGLVIFPASLLLIPLGGQLALLAFGPRWGGAGDAIRALALIGIGYTWTSVASEVYKAVGRPRLLTRIHLFWLVVSLVLLPSLVWANEIGIGIGVAAASVIQGLYALHLTGRLIDSSLAELLRRQAGSAVAAVLAMAAAGALELMVFAGSVDRSQALVAVVVESVVMLVVFLGALRLVAPTEAARIGELAGLLRRRGAPVEA